jgi:hypothetical protein
MAQDSQSDYRVKCLESLPKGLIFHYEGTPWKQISTPEADSYHLKFNLMTHLPSATVHLEQVSFNETS